MATFSSPRSEKTRDTRKRLECCWELDLSWDLYPSTLREGCFQVGKAMSVPPAAVLGGLLILTSFVLSPATITVPGTDWVEPGLIWLTISMPTGSRKTTIYQFLRRVLHEVREGAKCSDADPAWLLQDATFEKMGVLMAENGGRLLGMYDEMSAFLTKIKLHSSRGLTDTHELAMFLELFNANPWTRTTGEANFSMNSTSLTVGGFNQPAVARALIELPGNAEKGLSQRFLWLFPRPVYSQFDSLEPADKDFTDKIVRCLAGLWRKAVVGKETEKRNFCIPDSDDEGSQLASATFRQKYNMIQRQLQAIAAMDDLLSGMLSKSVGQILRVSLSMHVLFNMDSEEPLTEVIAQAAIKAAINFVEVCCQHTAYISGRGNIDRELELLETAQSSDGVIKGSAEVEQSNEAFVLSLPGKCLDVSHLVNKQKKFRSRGGKEGALQAMKKLEENGIGTLRVKKEMGSVKTWEFIKVDVPENDSDKSSLAMKLAEYHVSLLDYARKIDNQNQTLGKHGRGDSSTEEVLTPTKKKKGGGGSGKKTPSKTTPKK